MTDTKQQEFWEGELADTKTEVGRDLDVRIAELLGWDHETDPIELKRLAKYTAPDEIVTWWRRPDGKGWADSQTLPHYSTDPAAATGLLQEVLKRGWQAQVWISDVWRCKLLRPRPYKIIDTDAATLSGAIALAVLAALEADRAELGGETK